MSITISGESEFVQANGLRHHLLTYGDPGAQPLLILPGITSPAATADFLAIRIADLGFRPIVPDIRGRGQTEVPPAGSYTLDHYAADIAGLVGALGLSRPVIIGHSMGARIAAAYVTTYQPQDHDVVVLVDPPISGPERGPYPTSLASFMSQLNEAREGTTLSAVRRFYPKWPERELQIRIDVLPSCDETAVRETHAGFESEDFFPYWRRLTMPARTSSSTAARGARSRTCPSGAGPRRATTSRAARASVVSRAVSLSTISRSRGPGVARPSHTQAPSCSRRLPAATSDWTTTAA